MYKKNETSCLHVRDDFLIHISVRIVQLVNEIKKKEKKSWVMSNIRTR